jgi:DNA-directed RNA polymerase subunit beta'
MQQMAEAPTQSLEQSFPLLESATATASIPAQSMSADATGGVGFDPGSGHPGILPSSTGYEAQAPGGYDLGGGSDALTSPADGNYRDDLTIIEGIGPKIAELFFSYGINTFSDLASTAPDQLRQIMATDFASHDPSTWPDQAQMAATGDWEGLRAWQDQLLGGRDVGPRDDLTLIEGIGPKIAELLGAAGLQTFSDLANRQANEIAGLLGPEFAAHDPSTWPQQAQMASVGQWDQLRAWQDQLKGGRVEATDRDDLTLVEGVGPKIAELLNSVGITSWRQLAATPVDQIRELLVQSGEPSALHDPTTWPQQAQMAADGLFDELKAWQDELNGGRM